MRVAVWGAGAIGGVVGAWMARAGVDVLLVDSNEQHVAAIRDRGLLIDGIRGEFRVQVPALLPTQAEGHFDLILLSVKCLHTESALEALASHLAPEGAVVSLQNGLNEELIAARLGTDRTIGCFVNFGADWQAPGHIQHGGEHPLYIGELDGSRSPRLQEVASLLASFCETFITDNIWGYLWSKLCYASVLFGTALVDAPVYEVVRSEKAAPILFGLAKEVMAVADGKGIRLERLEDYWPEDYRGADWGPAMERSAAHFHGQIKVKTGVWRDLAVRRRRTEVDCQVAVAVQRGAELGVPMPLNQRLVELIHQIESGERGMSWDNFQAFSVPRPPT